MSERDAVVAAVRAAQLVARRETSRVRSFRNVLLLATTVLTLAAVGLALLGTSRPADIPLCFTPPEKVVCPTSETPVPPSANVDTVVAEAAASWDIPLVELLGLIAAALASISTLRNVRGTTTPYGIPGALVLLKLPTGALTAFLGLVLMRGEFLPGFGALSSTGAILAWAVIFGYAQQLLTRLVDSQADTLLAQARAEEERHLGRTVQPRSSGALPTQVGAAIRGSVPGALREAISGAPLINYFGWVIVRVQEAGGTRVEIEDHELTLVPGMEYTVNVVIASEPEAGLMTELRITDGLDGTTAPFEVSLDGNDGGVVPAERVLHLDTAGGREEVDFPLQIEGERSQSWLWIRVSQRQHVVLQVELSLSPAREGE